MVMELNTAGNQNSLETNSAFFTHLSVGAPESCAGVMSVRCRRFSELILLSPHLSLLQLKLNTGGTKPALRNRPPTDRNRPPTDRNRPPTDRTAKNATNSYSCIKTLIEKLQGQQSNRPNNQ